MKLPLGYRRRRTRRVMVGSVGVGGTEPIRVQSMCTTDTGHTEATARQVLRLAEAGCEIVRVTVPNMPDAHALGPLRERLEQLGVKVPLVADIHFNPHAAMVAADFVEKVRVNPGNYADTKKFAVREYTDEEYDAELLRIEEKFAPLVEKCRRLGRAMRIGTNHGSLSDRIMNRYGDSPEGMVESALEFVRICERMDYRDLVLSMKSSNPAVAVQAYRLLASEMADEGMDYPFHLGVTEAGGGEDGRVKSAIGIGSLLADGIGDTVRVSLTEDPVHEVPVAFELVAPYNAGRTVEGDAAPVPPVVVVNDAASMACGATRIGGEARVATFVDLGRASDAGVPALIRSLVAPPGSDEPLADVGFVRCDTRRDLEALEGLRGALWTEAGRRPLAVLLAADLRLPAVETLEPASMVFARPIAAPRDDDGEAARWIELARDAGLGLGLWMDGELPASAMEVKSLDVPLVAIVPPSDESPVPYVRLAMPTLVRGGQRAPLLLVDRSAEDDPSRSLLEGATRLGGLLVDGIGDAVLVTGVPAEESLRRALNVLQATRLRMTRPDYISCPSCGRTLFDLEEVTERIRSVTSHLKGVKIAIMGCIVNGPGEMADADFGYVGSSPGKINLYVGKECVAKNVPAAEADARLIALIKEHGRWIEPVAVGG